MSATLDGPEPIGSDEIATCPAGGDCEGRGWVMVADDGGWQTDCWCSDPERVAAHQAFPDHHPLAALANYRAGREVWDANGDMR